MSTKLKMAKDERKKTDKTKTGNAFNSMSCAAARICYCLSLCKSAQRSLRSAAYFLSNFTSTRCDVLRHILNKFGKISPSYILTLYSYFLRRFFPACSKRTAVNDPIRTANNWLRQRLEHFASVRLLKSSSAIVAHNLPCIRIITKLVSLLNIELTLILPGVHLHTWMHIT